MPEIISVTISLKDKLIAYMIAGTGSHLGISTVFFLKLRIQLFIYNRYFYLMFRDSFSFLFIVMFQFTTDSPLPIHAVLENSMSP